ncbi:MAG: four helix bundle protein [bacterium]|nr:four helix bundle protein [bacterium]
MLSIHDAPVFQKTYDLLKEIHVARRTFAKSEKYSLGETIERGALDTLLAIIDAGQEKREWKIAAIDRALHELERTKVLIRLTWDLEQITERRMLAWQETTQTIGRMLGGWRRSI